MPDQITVVFSMFRSRRDNWAMLRPDITTEHVPDGVQVYQEGDLLVVRGTDEQAVRARMRELR